jgi:pilus assembly protein CpaE
VPSSQILLLELDATSGEVISTTLTGVGFAVETVTDSAEAVRRAGDFSLVIIDQTDPAKSPADVCREIRATPELAPVPVLCIGQTEDVEERIRFLEAGADDVVAKPFDQRELEARVEALLLRFQRSRALAPMAASDGGMVHRVRRTVVAYSPKGGSGTTTVAVNVAVAHAAGRPGRVLIVDLDLQFGQVATLLNLTPKQTIADLVRDEQSQREPELLKTYVSHHESGLEVLAAPGSPELADLVTEASVGRILETALLAYDAVVVDAGAHLDARTMAALDAADTILIPVYPEIAALKAVQALLDFVNETGSISAKTTFVLNNVFAKQILKMRDVENGLGAKVDCTLPYDAFLYHKAANEGNPVVRGAAQSAAAVALVQLAATAFGETVGQTDGGRERRGRGLSGLLKRT